MDELDDHDKNYLTNDYERNSISEGFNLISKMQNDELILKQRNNATLAAALHDHISCTKLQPDLSRTDEGLFTLSLPKQKELNNSRNNDRFNLTNEQDETLKGIILVQLDLIQHQQEQLLKKERQLQSARQDCETMFKRLDSLEKENATLKEQLKKEESNKQFLNKELTDGLESQLTFCHFLTDPSNVLNTGSNVQMYTADQNNQFQQIIINKSPSPKQLIKQNEDAEQIDVETTKKTENNKKRKKSNYTSNKTNNLEFKNDSKLTNTTTNSASLKKKSSLSTGKKMNEKLIINNNGKKIANDKQPQKTSQSNITNSESFLQQHLQLPIKSIETDNPYEIVTNKDFFNSLGESDNDLDLSHDTQTKSNQQPNIEIPSWRLHPISCSYSLEGTENLDDSVFYRRHSKLELDEKDVKDGRIND